MKVLLKKTPARLDAALILLSALTGFFAMSFSPRLPPLILIVPLFWSLGSSRISAFCVVLAYHLTISRGLITGAAVFLPVNHTVADPLCQNRCRVGVRSA